jgi:hypothetical protein
MADEEGLLTVVKFRRSRLTKNAGSSAACMQPFVRDTAYVLL